MHSPRIALLFSLLCAAPLGAQQSPTSAVVPVREVGPATRAPESFANIFNVRQIANGQVLVNDGIRRQLLLLDRNLATVRVVLDSTTSSVGERYGTAAAPLIPYLGDSSLFVDRDSRALIVIDPAGKVARTVAPPTSSGDFRFLWGSTSGVDHNGNLLFHVIAGTPSRRIGDTTSSTIIQESRQPDSAEVLRARFDTRTTDTVGRVKQVSNLRSVRTQTPPSPPSIMIYISPIETQDDWAVLSDGTIAFVRGHDYHIDWIRPNGARESSEKLPFDWKRITEQDKEHIIDSTRAALGAVMSAADAVGGHRAANDALRNTIMGSVTLSGAAPPAVVEQRASTGAAAEAARKEPLLPYTFVPTHEIPDYYPPIRQGSVKADADGNLWILPLTTARSRAGELVYDVVNTRGILFERVRLPLGRAIAGFGPGGVVYLATRDGAGAWQLERTKVLR